MSVSFLLHRQALRNRAGSGRRFAVALMTLAATVSLAHPARGAVRTWQGVSRRSEAIDRFSPCRTQRRPLFGSYGWPVKPFDRPHPVRGNFGDPRTSFFGNLSGGSGAAGVFLFHNGVDISAPDGTAVYPVVAGRVVDVEADHITVATYDDRHFQYWHIAPLVAPGETVVADKTVLGRILPGLGHVHLTEIDRTHVVNPLLPGHLFPYGDTKPPRIDAVIVTDDRGRTLAGPRVADAVAVSAVAHDMPSIAPPGRWHDAVVSPATVSWSLTDAEGAIVRGPGTPFDVRYTLPPKRDFWRVYAPGTYQNFPVSDRRHLTTLLGNYVFHLTDLDTETLANGPYTLTVSATDICGNAGTLRTTIDVANTADGRGR